MIELKNVSKEERIKLFHNFEYFSFLIYRKDSCTRVVYKKLIEIVGEKYEQELWVLLTHVVKCINRGSVGYHFSLHSNNYTAANKRFKIKLSRSRMKELVSILDRDGYINLYVGFHTKVDSCLSVIVPQESLISLFNIHAVKKLEIKNNIDDRVDVVDKQNTTVKKTFNTKELRMDKVKEVVLKDVSKFSGSDVIIAKLKAYNTCIANNTITIDVGNGDEESNNIVYKRVFEDSLYRCGRYYTLGTFQTIPSEYRKTIKINGEKTVELDYANMHCRMIADIQDIKLSPEFDSYKVEKLEAIGLNRDTTKSLLFPMLFSPNKAAAVKSIALKLRENGLQHISASYVADCFSEHNSYLEDYFFSKDLYGDLQYLDSTIATRIIDHFTDKGVVVLTYHDSFVIQERYKDELYSVMSDSYLSVIKSNSSMLIREE